MKRGNAKRSVKEVYDDLARNGFPQSTLSQLVEAQYFEDELWPQYHASQEREASLLICFILEQKLLQDAPTIGALPRSIPDAEDERVSKLVGHVLSASLDQQLSFKVRSVCLALLISVALHLDHPLAQRALQPIVSILIWRDLLPAYRDELFEQTPVLKKRYRSRIKALDAASGVEKSRLEVECQYLSLLVLDVAAQINTSRNDAETISYCSRALELFNVLLSQFPTRRYTFYLLQDHQILCNVKCSARYLAKSQTGIAELKAQCALLEYFLLFSYDNINGKAFGLTECQKQSDMRVSKLQRLAFTDFKESLMLLALSNHSSLTDPEELQEHLKDLKDDELRQLCTKLNIRSTIVSAHVSGTFMRAYLAQYLKQPPSIRRLLEDQARSPTESDLFSDHCTMLSKMRVHLPIPKLTLQYLSFEDFLYRSMQLLQTSAYLHVRAAISNTLIRMGPQIIYPTRKISYNGSSSHGLLISPPAIVEVAPRELSASCPGFVRAEVKLQLEDLQASFRNGWQSLKKGDILFFVHLAASDETSSGVPRADDPDFATKIGIRSMRSATIDAVLRGDGKPLHLAEEEATTDTGSGRNRLLRVFFDRVAYQRDSDGGRLSDVYDNLNIVIKRSSAEQTRNAKIIKASHAAQPTQLTSLHLSEPLPGWLNDTFLGYGEPAQNTWPQRMNLFDTFLNSAHAKESFMEVKQTGPMSPVLATSNSATEEDYAKMTVAILKSTLQDRGLTASGKKAELIARLLEDDKSGSSQQTSSSPIAAGSSHYSLVARDELDENGSVVSRKRKREGEISDEYDLQALEAPLSSPYYHSRSRRNCVRYTNSQIEAIIAGTAPGLTIIDGPPSSGKSSLLSQVLANVYHNESAGRILVLCKSQEVLDGLYAFLGRLNIQCVHILRLYALDQHTQDVDIVLSRRAALLTEVSRLATSLAIQGDHAASCETAEYFYKTVIGPKLEGFSSQHDDFTAFFADASRDEGLSDPEYNKVCAHYISSIFAELAEIRPMELLSTAKSQQEFLLAKLSKIVLMSTEYASKNEHTLALANINFSTIVLHQGSIITEVDAVVPFKFVKDVSVVQRVILTGDSQQEQPKSQNVGSVSRSSNADQSLFARLKRSGVSTITLQDQFSCQHQISDVYRHRYANLNCNSEAVMTQANAGLVHIAQFINVPSYKGQGETSPRADVWQNLGEAEYLVALYQYMRLLNYPKDKITILTPFAGQKTLIQEVLDSRCKRSPIFGLPSLATVDDYHGQKNDYVLLSLVRTSPSVELQGLNMMTTALSRGTKGLYVFGRHSAMPSILKPFLCHLEMAQDAHLELVTGEMYPTKRQESDANVQATVMAGVEHLGKYVYEMTQKKLQAMNGS